MDLSRDFILLNGEPKTLQIDSIQRNGGNGYSVRFKNNGRIYNYGFDKVIWLRNPKYIDPALNRVSVNGVVRNDVRELWKYDSAGNPCWRIVYSNGVVQDDSEGRVSVERSCLHESSSKNVFAYMRDVAAVNQLGRSEDSPEGTLSKIYDAVKFIDEKSAAACYVNPAEHGPRKLRHSYLIYPFGCNASQKKAVANAFEQQISVIQGPPGTGKTQTILNIIANIVCHGKTVMVVSNNNSATANVLEKLQKYGVGFIAAPLGSRDNKEAFISSQPGIPAECSTWVLDFSASFKMKKDLNETLQQLENVYSLQHERAELLQEQRAISLEWKHFCMDNEVDDDLELDKYVDSRRVMSLWVKFQIQADGDNEKPASWLVKWIRRIKLRRMMRVCRQMLDVQVKTVYDDLTPFIRGLQSLYYRNRIHELERRIESINQDLVGYDAEALNESLMENSMALFRSSLYGRYGNRERTVFSDVKDMRRRGREMLEQYPVVLSTTMSARSCMFLDSMYDYLIMDEASQVSSDTGTLALTCARNAVIVGDTKQLPNVETDEDRKKLREIAGPYDIPEGYDCAKYSFLESLLKVVPDVAETMLREHYRCHPRIINFCNQKFYGGNLLIMTEDNGERNVLSAIRTSKGNHAADHFNQREIDVVKEEVLPRLGERRDIGIVTPYNNQVEAFNRQLHGVKAGTIHKYQGREADTIIMSTVDNQISEFADDARMLNVAVSRARNRFCLVMTGNEQGRHGNIMDLLDYILYNNCEVSDSKLASVFDYLYSQYSEQRIAFLRSHPQISEYASENLTYSLLCDVLSSDSSYRGLETLCHVPLRQVVRDTSLMSSDELKYAANYSTHLDFLIINMVSKQPVLAVETDGYAYHNDKTVQHRRDLMKNHILATYGLPLLRLSTKGSCEKEKIIQSLNAAIR